MKKKTKKDYEDFLNKAYTVDSTKSNTSYLLKSNGISSIDRRCIKKYSQERMFGTILRLYDKERFNSGFDSWK